MGYAEISGNKHQHMLYNKPEEQDLIYTLAEA
jgi:hypothetical protein